MEHMKMGEALQSKLQDGDTKMAQLVERIEELEQERDDANRDKEVAIAETIEAPNSVGVRVSLMHHARSIPAPLTGPGAVWLLGADDYGELRGSYGIGPGPGDALLP